MAVIDTNLGIDEVYRKLLHETFTVGKKVIVRKHKTRDIGLKVNVFHKPWLNISGDHTRKLNYAFMFRELWWYLTGDDRVWPLKAFNSNIAQFSDNGKIMFGAYGPFIAASMPTIIAKLKEDIFTRQAVIPIYNITHNAVGYAVKSKDIPCTLGMHFISNDGKTLNLITNMRSQDIWWGFPYDVANFSMILCILAKYLGLEIGQHVHITDSTHIYEERISEITKFLGQHPNYKIKMNRHNTEINKSWLKDFNFLSNYDAKNTIIQDSINHLDLMIKVHEENKKGFEYIADKLLERINLAPIMFMEHISYMACYLMKKNKIDNEKFGKFNEVLINIDSPFRWLV